MYVYLCMCMLIMSGYSGVCEGVCVCVGSLVYVCVWLGVCRWICV